MTRSFINNFQPKRDAYGFTVRPQHLQSFKEFDSIYKKEEEERTAKWRSFLEQHTEFAELNSSVDTGTSDAEVTEQTPTPVLEVSVEADVLSERKPTHDNQKEGDSEEVVLEELQAKNRVAQNWAELRPSLNAIESMMSFRVKSGISMTDEARIHRATLDTMDSSGGVSAGKSGVSPDHSFLWRELESLVHGGVPRHLRGEVWQAFVGVRTRRVERYYQDLLDVEGDAGGSQDDNKLFSRSKSSVKKCERVDVPEKCRKQIEKDLPRTFPGHPALDGEGRNSLRRLLIAYARHNPAVGYCQAMNFFAGLLLLMMPEENAFWTLVGIIDDYFNGYFTMEMIECQVDQLVFEDLMRERYPKLVNHFDFLGVEMGWICGPWFLSIFVNMIPWESVLRVWDVILFEGNRVMLFRTAMALMELYGNALSTTKDAGDAITLLQSCAGSTFDSTNLVLTACVTFSYINEDQLQQLRGKHRPDVMAAIEERARGEQAWKDSKGLASKLYSFKQDPKALVQETDTKEEEDLSDEKADGDKSVLVSSPSKIDKFLSVESEVDSLPDLKEQVVWLKAELCTMLEEKRSATLRAEELETALMEMVKQDNRRELSARIEQLEREVAELQQALADKKAQEKAMLEVLMRLEQEQKVTEDARRFAEQDAAAQRYAVHVLEEKYEKAMASLAQMEKRVVMAESMLEATLQYESGQVKALASPALASPRPIRTESPNENIQNNTATRSNQNNTPTKSSSQSSSAARRIGILSFGLNWRDRNRARQANAAAQSENKTTNEAADMTTAAKTTDEAADTRTATQTEMNGHQEPEK